MTVQPRGSFNGFLLASLVAAPLAASFALPARAQDAAAPAAEAPAANPTADIWRQFSHYTLIARPDLAACGRADSPCSASRDANMCS